MGAEFVRQAVRSLCVQPVVQLARLGARLAPPYDLRLAALYLDPAGGPGANERLLQVFEQFGAAPSG